MSARSLTAGLRGEATEIGLPRATLERPTLEHVLRHDEARSRAGGPEAGARQGADGGGATDEVRAAEPSARSAPDGPGLTHASLIAFLLYVAGAGLAYVMQLVIARLVGPESFGVYSYVLAWVTLLAYGCTLGFNVSLLRFVPAYQAGQDWERARGVVRYAYRRALAASLVAASAGTAIVLAWSGRATAELVTTFVLGLWSVPLITVLLVSMGVARAFGGVVSALAPERVVRDSLLLVLVGLAAWSGLRRPDAALVMAAMLASTAAALAMITVSLRGLTPASMRSARPVYAVHDWRPTILPITLMAASEVLISRAGVMLLGVSGKVQDAGVIALAINLAAIVTLPRVAVGTLFSPKIARLHALQDTAGMQALFARATALTLLGAAALGIPLLLATELLLGWFGSDFVGGAAAVRILVVGQLVSAAAGPQQSLMTMMGCERAGAALLTASAGVNLAACAVAASFAGVTAVALATAGALIAWNVGMSVFMLRKLHIVPGLLRLTAPAAGPRG